MRQKIGWVICAGITLGCGHAFEMKTPANFVLLEEDNEMYAARLTNAHGVVLAIRELDNEPRGSLQFWTDVVRGRLRNVSGYALLEEKEVRARSGQRGRQLQFGRDQNRRPYVYWVTVFATSDRIYVVEAGGGRKVFEQARPQVEQAIADLQLD